MTKFTDLQIGRVGAPDGSATNYASIDSSGTAVFLGPLTVSGASNLAGTVSVSGQANIATLNIVNAVTTVAATGTSAVIPASAAGFLEVQIGGTTRLIPFFQKA